MCEREKKVLQGDRIEHPDFMEENNIQIDYKFYISNQQLFVTIGRKQLQLKCHLIQIISIYYKS